MAKAAPELTIKFMEDAIGYNVPDAESYQAFQRFYTNLRPVPASRYERTKKEFSEFVRRKSSKPRCKRLTELLPKPGEEVAVRFSGDKVVITQQPGEPYFRFTVDMHLEHGLHIPFMMSDLEASQLISVNKLGFAKAADRISPYFRLPFEIRQSIYTFAIPTDHWHIADNEAFARNNLPRGLGDLSGFYYPVRKDLSLLTVNKQMRREALPIVYRQTHFQIDDVDDTVKFLLAIGRTGRNNIESLDFSWESKADSEEKQMNIAATPGSADTTLPLLHALSCSLLLKECRRLRRLRLYLDDEVVEKFSVESFMADPGIIALCSVRGIARVEIWSLMNGPFERCKISELLRDAMERQSKASGPIIEP